MTVSAKGRLGAFDWGRSATGAFALVAPREFAARYGADPDDHVVRIAVRALGARHVALVVLLLVWPAKGGRRAAAAVDLLHATSMLLLAAGVSRYRRPALTSAAVATAFAVGTLVTPWAGRRSNV